MATNLVLFVLNVFRRALGRCGSLDALSVVARAKLRMPVHRSYLVSEHENIRMIHEILVDVFQRASGRLRIEEVNERHERAVEYCPDNVELPAEISDADGSDFHDDEVAYKRTRSVEGIFPHLQSNRQNLHSQFVAVPNAAPLFFIDKELISAFSISFCI